MHITVSIALQVFQGIFAFSAGVVAINSFFRAIGALRAKRDFRNAVQVKIEYDGDLKAFQQHIIQSQLNASEMQRLLEKLEKISLDLPKSERNYVQKTLSQPSKAGERRFVASIMAPSN
jgi:hypothetical protein